MNSNTLTDLTTPLLELVKKRYLAVFGHRIIAMFTLGSLGSHGDFSPCSDIDVAVFLDNIKKEDQDSVLELWNELKASKLPYAEVLSVFWSSYDKATFSQGIGRFPALDRLDLIDHGKLIYGIDKRSGLPKPTAQEMLHESAEFIISYLLTTEKLEELILKPKIIINKGARYYTKFVLFPVRLLLTLENPSIVASNHDAVKAFCKHNHYSKEIKTLVKNAYQLRNLASDTTPNIDNPKDFQRNLISLYGYCLNQYHKWLLSLDTKLAFQIGALQERITKPNPS